MNIYSFKERAMRRLKRPFYKKQRAELANILQDMEQADLSKGEIRFAFSERLQEIDEDIIISELDTGNFSLIFYVLSIKYSGNIKVIPMENDVAFWAGGHFIANMSYIPAAVHFIEIKDGWLYIEGHVTHPSIYKERCSFGIENNGKKIDVQMYDGNLDLKKGINTYETRTAFRVQIPLAEDENAVAFYNYFDGVKCRPNWMMIFRFSPVAAILQGQYAVRNGWMLYLENNILYCKKADRAEIQQKEEWFQKSLLEKKTPDAEWAVSIRQEYFERVEKKEKPIWLFIDRVDRADDNAEALYRYVRKRKEVDAYFIIQKGTQDYERLQELGNIVEANSKEHFMLVLLAEYIISSQANGIIENPFWNKAEYLRDLYHQAKIVFLQHGVIKDDMSITLNRFHTNFYGFVTSSHQEWQSILDYPYAYTSKEVWLMGLPRFDYLYNNPQKYILIMPSWRQGLMHQVWDESKNSMIWAVSDDFLESEYVKKYRSLLSNQRLQEVCKKYDYKLAFMPHALMEPYIDNFIQNEECVYWDASKSYRDAFAEGNLMVTDFSSVAFDFAYLQKPIIYYQFDKERFFEEHTYKQGYFEYEKDGFGEVVYEEDLLVQLIIEYIEKDCTIKDKYKERIENTFAYLDKNCCERIYSYLKK